MATGAPSSTAPAAATSPPATPGHSGAPSPRWRRVSADGSAVGSTAGPEAAVIDISYSDELQRLALVLADGSVALCQTAAGGILPLGDLLHLHWACGPCGLAVRCALCARAQMLAVGFANGHVGLYRCGGGGCWE